MLGGFKGHDGKHHLDPGRCVSCGSDKCHLSCSAIRYSSYFLTVHNFNLFPFPIHLSYTSQTLSWLKDNVSMATQVCSIASFEGLESARRCQHALEQEILTNRARIEVVKRVSLDYPLTFTLSLQTQALDECLK